MNSDPLNQRKKASHRQDDDRLVIGVVGPCASGKSSLVARLKQHGFWGKHIAQEHSYVQDMWNRITRPDVLIYLQVSYPVSLKRRKMNWSEREYLEQVDRLQHARQNADFLIDTDPLSEVEVFERVVDFLETSINIS